MTELLIVAFGVFLGMVVSDWNANRKTATQVEKTKQYIINELKTNVHNLNYSIEYHKQLRTEFDSLAALITEEDLLKPFISNKLIKFNKIPSWTGPGTSLLDKSVYEGAKVGNLLQEFDIETLQMIARTYRHQDGYELLSKKIVDRMMNINFDTKTIDGMGTLELIVFDILGNEKVLKKHLEATIEKLELGTSLVKSSTDTLEHQMPVE